jgi:hypothetical protein
MQKPQNGLPNAKMKDDARDNTRAENDEISRHGYTAIGSHFVTAFTQKVS